MTPLSYWVVLWCTVKMRKTNSVSEDNEKDVILRAVTKVGGNPNNDKNKKKLEMKKEWSKQNTKKESREPIEDNIRTGKS